MPRSVKYMFSHLNMATQKYGSGKVKWKISQHLIEWINLSLSGGYTFGLQMGKVGDLKWFHENVGI